MAKLKAVTSEQVDEVINGDLVVTGNLKGGWASEVRADLDVLQVSAAPRPKATAGIGQWTLISAASGAALALPAGGKWAYFGFRRTDASGALNGAPVAGVAAGGTTILTAVAVCTPYAVAWKVI